MVKCDDQFNQRYGQHQPICCKKNVKQAIMTGVIQLLFDLEKLMFIILEHQFKQREGPLRNKRGYIALPSSVALVKCLIVSPLNHEKKFQPYVKDILDALEELKISCNIDNINDPYRYGRAVFLSLTIYSYIQVNYLNIHLFLVNYLMIINLIFNDIIV